MNLYKVYGLREDYYENVFTSSMYIVSKNEIEAESIFLERTEYEYRVNNVEEIILIDGYKFKILE